MEQTALSWLLDQLPPPIQVALLNTSIDDIVKAKEMEMKQMKDSWINGYHKAKDDIICDTFSTFEKFYTENFHK